MKKLVLAGLGIMSTAFAVGQDARLVLYQNVYMTFGYDAPTTDTYLVISNPASNGLTVSATGGNIITEHERNRIRWVNGTTVASVGSPVPFTIPFTTRSLEKIPLTVTKTSTGTATAVSSMVFSTYNWEAGTTALNAWNNSAYMPSGVAHVNSDIDGTNNSDNALDRFWIIDPSQAGFAYTAKPDVRLTIDFSGADAATNGAPGNTSGLVNTLAPQRYNSGTGQWGDYFPTGTLDAGNTIVSNINISGANFFRSWTLASSLEALPIELLSWTGKCDGDRVLLEWITATEQNNDLFTIERSLDALSWEPIGTVQGAGNSLNTLNYSFEDRAPANMAYYRLRQTDFDGTSVLSAVIPAGCNTPDGIDIVSAWDDGTDLNVMVSSTFSGNFELTLMDAQGKVMAVRPNQVVNKGGTLLKVDKTNIATGIYMLRLHDNSTVLSRRVMVN
ncbi:MAG TPA: T9SS type A sorting domain-containing protein [Flavobacteriales bacterium]